MNANANKPNVNVELLRLVGYWDLHFSGFDITMRQFHAHGDEWTIGAFEETIDQYMSIICEKLAENCGLTDLSEPEVFALMDADIDQGTIKAQLAELGDFGATQLTGGLLAHIWNLHYAGNQSIWLELQDLLDHLVPMEETETHDEPVAQGV